MNNGSLPQLAEGTDLESGKSRFESEGGYGLVDQLAESSGLSPVQ